MGRFTSPFIWSFRLTLISINAERCLRYTLHFSRRYPNLARWLFSRQASAILMGWKFHHGIYKLPKIWQNVITSDRQYFDWHVLLVICRNKTIFLTKKGRWAQYNHKAEEQNLRKILIILCFEKCSYIVFIGNREIKNFKIDSLHLKNSKMN